MQSQAQTVDAYLAEVPPKRLAALQSLRALIRKIAPAAREKILYGMPCYTLDEEIYCGFASQKQYMALYVCADTVDQYRDQLGKLNCGKGCIRFHKWEDLPLKAIEGILRDTAKLHQAGT